MARSLYGCALVAAICVSTVGRSSQAQQPGAPSAAEAPPTAAALEARIETALGEVASLQFTESPLSDIVEFLKERHKLAIQLDTAALDTAGVTHDTPATIDVEGVTLRSALHLMLKSVELTYCLQDGVLLITTIEEVEGRRSNEVYDASHFLYTTDPYGARKRDGEALVTLVSTHICPTCWANVGGNGAIHVLDRSLVVSQDWHTQREVGDFMATIEKALAQYKQGNFQSPLDVGPNDTSSTKAVRRALAEATSLQFTEAPLSAIVAHIQERHKLAVQLDTAALDTAGVTIDTPVTIDIEGVPLANALNLMLKSLELTYVVRDEVLLVTTLEEVDNRLFTRIYPAKDLVEAEERAAGSPQQQSIVAPGSAAKPAQGGGGASPYLDFTGSARKGAASEPTAETEKAATEKPAAAAGGGFGQSGDRNPVPLRPFDTVLELITSNVEPTTWTDVGGTGAISYVPEFQGIAISQTADVHAQIDDLFARLRKVSAAQLAAASDLPVDDAAQAFSLRPYYLTFSTGATVKDVSSVSQLIQRAVEPASWHQNNGKSFVHVVDDALMIQTTNAAHEQIAELLNQLEIRHRGFVGVKKVERNQGAP